jgi:hypothetical protein
MNIDDIVEFEKFFKIELNDQGNYTLYKRPWRGSLRWVELYQGSKDSALLVMTDQIERFEKILSERNEEFYDISGKRVWA